MATTKGQTESLKKKLEGAIKAKDTMEKARDEAMKARVKAKRAKEQVEETKEQTEQEAYEMGVVETETDLKAQVLGVCRLYYSQVWAEALNRARVKASSELRRAENVYYPLQSESLLLPILKPTLPPKRQRQVKIMSPTLLVLLTSLPRRLSILGCQKKTRPLTKKHPRM